jgi:hypothetical protein
MFERPQETRISNSAASSLCTTSHFHPYCERTQLLTLFTVAMEDQARYRGSRLFTPAALRAIWECSGGVPREINTLCFNALLLATAVAQKQVDSHILHDVVADLDLNAVEFDREIPPRPIKSMQTADVLTDADGDPLATSIDQIRKAAVPSAKTELDDVYTRPAASDGAERVRAAEIPPANCRDRPKETVVSRAELQTDDLLAHAAVYERVN